MGLGLLAASRALRSSRSLSSPIIRTIGSTISRPNRTPVGGARVQFANPDDAIEVFVDGFPVKIPKGMTVLQACEVAGVDIPRFCYHNRLSGVCVSLRWRSSFLCNACASRDEDQDRYTYSQEGKRRSDGVSADEPSIRLSNL